MSKRDIYQKLESLVSESHQFACSLDIGDERVEAFEFYEALRRLQRRGSAGEMLAATNPLLSLGMTDGDFVEDFEDEDED